MKPVEDNPTLPDNWCTTHLGTVCDLVNGDRGKNYPGRKALLTEGIPFVNAGDIQDALISNERLGYISPEIFDLLRSGKFVLGDILYCIRGSLGKVAFNRSLPTGAIASSLIIVRANPAIAPKYIFYYLMSPLAGQMIARFDNGTAQPNLSGADLAKFQVPLPGPRTQHKVVAKIEELFSELDKGVESLTTAREQLKAYRQSVLRAAFAGELTGSDAASWSEYTLGQLVTDVRYGTARKCTVDPSKTPVLRIPNIASGRIDLSDLKHADFEPGELDKLRLEVGDILLVRSNGSASLVGLSAVVADRAVGYAYAGYLIRLRLKKDMILPEFLNFYLHSPVVRTAVERQARSTSGVHNINSDEVRAISLRLPAANEQRRIVDRLTAITTEIDAIEICIARELQRSGTLRQSILKGAFSGGLVTQDQSDEPASALLDRIRAERDGATRPTKERNPKNGEKRVA